MGETRHEPRAVFRGTPRSDPREAGGKALVSLAASAQMKGGVALVRVCVHLSGGSLLANGRCQQDAAGACAGLRPRSLRYLTRVLPMHHADHSDRAGTDARRPKRINRQAAPVAARTGADCRDVSTAAAVADVGAPADSFCFAWRSERHGVAERSADADRPGRQRRRRSGADHPRGLRLPAGDHSMGLELAAQRS